MSAKTRKKCKTKSNINNDEERKRQEGKETKQNVNVKIERKKENKS